ncbi:hypothetical protein G4B88_005081 [Cannabis sativa]|uniref:Uncharacterized protein n=1 Tax=Cannabis sativa TaxID=3483 RepID=A0A7J6H4L6_CANSA|nr:hypothetical protein G4B88_005081 [Cannabis sativa]
MDFDDDELGYEEFFSTLKGWSFQQQQKKLQSHVKERRRRTLPILSQSHISFSSAGLVVLAEVTMRFKIAVI